MKLTINFDYLFFKISNCGDTLKTLVSYISNLDLPFISYEQAMFVSSKISRQISTKNIHKFFFKSAY